MFIVKEFFQKTIKSQNLDSRSDNCYVNNNDRRNYIFNSSLNGIEESDLIILVGANPRYEATILNARVRKSFLNNKTEIYSFGDIGELTYPYKILDNKTDTIKDIFENKNELVFPISDKNVALIIKKHALSAGLDEKKYAGHSLRSGFATTTAEYGASERNIMAMTGHKSVDMVRRYIKEADLFKINIKETIN